MIFNRTRLILGCTSFLFPLWVCGKAPIEEKLEGPETVYTRYLIEVARRWETAGPPTRLFKDEDFPIKKADNPVALRCLVSPSTPYAIGVAQKMKIQASMPRVEAVLDDMDHYHEFFIGFDDIHVVSRKENKIVLHWEQHIPFFLVPNVHYEVTYLVDKSKPRKFYRYQLKTGGKVKNSDGLIILEEGLPTSSGAPTTLYYEADFYDADWGLLKNLAPGKIWKESVEGFYLSDTAILLKAEHPDWSNKKVVQESKKALEKNPIDVVIESKQVFHSASES